jgi:hypothetical protein
MKKVIASALAVLLGSLGFLVVDKTIEERVLTLESQVASLSAGNDNAPNDKTYKVGDKIPCYPETPYSFDSVVGYSDEIKVCIDSFSAEIIGIDELNTEGETVTRKTTTQSTSTLPPYVTTSPERVTEGRYNVYNCYKYSVKLNISGKIQNIDEFGTNEIKLTFFDSYGFSFEKSIAIGSDGSFSLSATQSFFTIPEKIEISDIDIHGYA